MNNSSQAALIVMQQAVKKLAIWSGADLPPEFNYPPDTNVVEVAKKQIGIEWGEETPLKALRLLFDQVQLEHEHQAENYWDAIALSDSNPPVPYPQTMQPEDMGKLKEEIRSGLGGLTAEDWNNLSLLTLIVDKFGSFISCGEADIALSDLARTTAAVASAMNDNPDTEQLSLIAGDLSGIQKFIYTISSDGALKSLRARSFYLELVTEEVVQRLLEALQLPRTNVIYAGGGNLFILAPIGEEVSQKIREVRKAFNHWLLGQFQNKVFLALDHCRFDIRTLSNTKINPQSVRDRSFSKVWSTLPKQLAKQKAQRFADQINDILAPQKAYTPCKVCHRDDQEELFPLNKLEEDSVLACDTCRKMFALGSQILNTQAIIRFPRRHLNPEDYHNVIDLGTVYYRVLREDYQQYSLKNGEKLFLVNNWTISNYRQTSVTPLLLGNYGAESQEEQGIMSAREMADKAKGIKRVGYLRMDVDKLGRIFAEGLGESRTLTRIAGLSRLMTYFFKVYLNQLAEKRAENTEGFKTLTSNTRQNLLFIYAGGDDVFISGAWNQVVEFGFDLYQAFRAYTGHNPNITLSAGVTLAGAKFPLYQAAKLSGNAEEEAKGNDRDSLTLFNCTFKWSEWLGTGGALPPQMRDYLQTEVTPPLVGIFPFVQQLEEIDYHRAFIRNLLATAQLQEQAVKDAKEKQLSPEKQNDLQYFLHLPKVAYTLTRLPRHVLTPELRQSFKSPYNALYFRAIATWIELLNRGSVS